MKIEVRILAKESFITISFLFNHIFHPKVLAYPSVVIVSFCPVSGYLGRTLVLRSLRPEIGTPVVIDRHAL